MGKIKKVFILNILYLLIAVIFSITGSAQSIDLSNRTYLRVPISTLQTKTRLRTGMEKAKKMPRIESFWPKEREPSHAKSFNEVGLINIADFKLNESLGGGIPLLVLVKAAEHGQSERRLKMFERYKDYGVGMHRPRKPKHGFIAGVTITYESTLIESKSLVQKIELEEPKGIAVNDRYIVVAGLTKIYVFSALDGKIVKIIEDEQNRLSSLHTLQFSPYDSSRLLVASIGVELVLEIDIESDEIVRIWDPWENGLNVTSEGTIMTNNIRNDVTDPLGLTDKNMTVQINGAFYGSKPDLIYVTSFKRGQVLAINLESGEFRIVVEGLDMPHGFTKSHHGGRILSNTLKGHVYWFDEDMRPQFGIDFSSLPGKNKTIGEVEWLQDTHYLKDGIYVAVDSVRNGIWLFNLKEKTRRFVPVNPDWSMQEVVLDIRPQAALQAFKQIDRQITVAL